VDPALPLIRRVHPVCPEPSSRAGLDHFHVGHLGQGDDPPGTAGQAEASSVPDRVVSSYIPTLTALRRARDGDAGRGAFGGLLAVGMPETPDRSVVRTGVVSRPSRNSRRSV
jgi:hypothetical protein